MLVAWLAFIANGSGSLRDLDEGVLRDIAELTEGVEVSDDEELDVDL